MSKEIIVSPSPHETKVALVEEGQVVEIFVEREKEIGLVGSIYKGRVTRVLPGMQSAFVDIGLERDAFLYVSDFFEGLEEYERDTTSEPEAEVAEIEAAPQPAAEEARASEPAQPSEEEEPQPAYPSHEPPVQLPERRPRGRGRRGRGGSRHRGGRGRRPDRDRRPERPVAPRPAFAEAAPGEPIILPGESLAKYRDRVRPPAPPKPSEPAVAAPEAPPAEAPVLEAPAVVSPAEPAAEVEVAPPTQPVEAPAAEQPAAAEPEPLPEEKPVAVEEVAVTAEPEAPPATAAATEGAATQESPVSSPAAEVYPDAVTLAEIQRVRQYEDQVGLPPSLHERTEGGVEWQRRREGGRPRGGRFRRGRGGRRGPQGRAPQARRERRPQPARPTRGQPAIAELLRSGQEIIVQIAKEQMGKKGARITSHVTLPGRFLVYMPTIDHIGISRRIGTSEERSRLRRLLLELKGSISGGFVVRTAATGCSEEDLRQDIDYLVKLWHDIRVRADESPAPLVLHRDLSLVERILRDHLTNDYESVWIDNEEEYAKVLEFVGRLQPNLARRVKLYTKPAPIFEEMGVQQEIDRALHPKVWLKSGGYIVINHTEALVAIDVNTGKFVGKGSTRLEDTIVKTNVEAVQEIVRQIRLRDLGGIIVIDFIDMEDSRNRHKVMRALEDALRHDRSPSKLLSFNEFGLVAITRKRSRQSLERVLCQSCPTCTGTGMVKSAETLCYEIQWETRKMAAEIDAPELTIRAHPDIVKALKGGDHALVHELEEQTGKNIILHSDNGLHFTEYNIY